MRMKCAIVALMMGLSSPVLAETLTTDSIISLTSMGLGDEAIIAKMSVKAALQNETARVKAHSKPYFFFFFDESNALDNRANGTWAAGTAATVTSPSEFTLIRLTRKKGRREARVGSVNIAGAKSGVMDKDRLAFDYKMVRPGVFKAKAAEPLPPGEYGFIYAIAGSGAGGAMTARVFDFSVE